MRSGYLLAILLFSIVLEVLAWATGQEKQVKDVRIGKETVIIHSQYDYIQWKPQRIYRYTIRINKSIQKFLDTRALYKKHFYFYI